ncbi:MAG TPA: hypothetical protein VFG03_20855, partial [Telluria sp.]|nr:hypothetical protein [Telluria sp.]
MSVKIESISEAIKRSHFMITVLGFLSPLRALALAPLRALRLVAEPDPVDFAFTASEVAQLQRVSADPAAPAIDAQTWNDLLLDSYSALLSHEVSIFGQQVLHQRLRAGLGEADCGALGERVRTLIADPALLEQLHADSRDLRRADTDIAALLFETAQPPEPGWVRYWWLMPLGLLACVAGAMWTPFAWLGAGYAMYRLIAPQMIFYSAMQAWERSLLALQMLLRTCSLLGVHRHHLLQAQAALAARAGALNRGLSRASALGPIPGLRAYADWFLLDNVRHYFRSIRLVHAQRAVLRDCYLACANLEADIALARHLLHTPASCWAQRHDGSDIVLVQVVHPLLEDAAPLDVELIGKGAFVSGQNGSGKSTLLRTIGLNLVVARAFGFCYAANAQVPALPVYASMQSEDSLLGGESLYMAELRRATELLAAADGPHGGVYIIDEIFRGTNHLESVSAAAAVLDALAARGKVIVSSHNLVLASLLEHRLAPLCVSAAGGRTLALVLVPGVLTHTNGIALLAAHRFGAGIEANAVQVFDW